MDPVDLEKFGLNKNEAKVYLELLKKREAIASDLVKATDLHRNIIYDNLEKLIEKGLVSFIIENNIKTYVAEDPKTILEFLNNKKEKIDTQINKANKLLPDINKLLSRKEVSQQVTIFRGKKGMKKVLLDLLDYGEFWSIGFTNESVDVFTEHFGKAFRLKKEQKRVKEHSLFTYNFENTMVYDDGLTEIRRLPKELDQVTEIYLYGDYTAIAVYSLNPIAIIIKDSNISYAFKKHFNFLWKLSKPVKLKNRKHFDFVKKKK
jgi:sugar-specific transcriptional regulator TrmB